MAKNKTINVKETKIVILAKNNKDERISLTRIARYRDAKRSNSILQHWLKTRSTIEFAGLWEQFNNSGFNSIEFDGIKNQAGSNCFLLIHKQWIDAIAIKENFIPTILSKTKINFVYADEADMLNMALFRMTAKQWRDASPKAEGNHTNEIFD